MRPEFVTEDGSPVCQAHGCRERAKPWPYVVDFPPIEIDVYLCARHQQELLATDTSEEATS